MKKCKTMRLASAMLVLTLLSTCMISGTFAKYVTSDSASDSARVAKWGVEVVASGSLFGQHYAAKADGNSIITADTGTVAVTSGDTDDVVAPGTKNETGMTFKVTGTPEVDSAITVEEMESSDPNYAALRDIFLKKGSYAVMVEVAGVTDDNFGDYYVLDGTSSYRKVDSTSDTYSATGDYYEVHDAVTFTEDYYPINWTLKNNGTEVSLTDEKVATLYAALKSELETTVDNQATVPINELYTITWEWDFDDNTNGTNDGKDTILGNIIAGSTVVKTANSGVTYVAIENDDYSTEIGFNVKVTVTQVD